MNDPHHATCVSIAGDGVLLIGPSGSGKSDLALRLIDRGAVLVGDDYTVLQAQAGELVATAPMTIAGQMEVRGLGIVPFPTAASAVVRLAVQLTQAPPRFPDAAEWTAEGVALPLLRLDPFAASAPIKVELALARLVGRRA